MDKKGWNDQRKRRLDKKWESLQKRGFVRPENSTENKKRAREAHHGRG